MDSPEDFLEKWNAFDSCIKKPGQNLDEFICSFESKYSAVESGGTVLPEEVLVCMLMKRAELNSTESRSVLSGVNLHEKSTLYTDVKRNMVDVLRQTRPLDYLPNELFHKIFQVNKIIC